MAHTDLLDALVAEQLPDDRGRYGPFGGRFVPEILMGAITRLEENARAALDDATFMSSLEEALGDWVGRPTPFCPAPGLSAAWGAEIWLKREDLAHTGAHKINNALGQAMLAKRMGATRVVAETGAGQHGVASAAACARVGIDCTVYMGAIDVDRQAPNVDRMRRLGATVVPVQSGDRTLRAAIDEALRAWVADPEGTFYLLGSAVGPHPYPWLVCRLHSVIGREARSQCLARRGRLPDAAIACVGGGSNAIGLFHPFVGDTEVALIGIEAGGNGLDSGHHAATLTAAREGLGARLGVLHGARSMLLQDGEGQVHETHSISAGLDYPGVGPEHALLAHIGRARYEAVEDTEALAAFDDCCALEGIIPALETSHALAGAKRYAAEHPGALIVVGLSGRGDKDLPALQRSHPVRDPAEGGA
ncbi:MAG: tryptophan synthase subunit beta [Bradymonadia bacterium]